MGKAVKHAVKSLGSTIKQVGVLTLMPLTCFLILDKLLDLSKPLFPSLYNGDDEDSYFAASFSRSYEISYVKLLEKFLHTVIVNDES